jgi:hypothetical protein
MADPTMTTPLHCPKCGEDWSEIAAVRNAANNARVDALQKLRKEVVNMTPASPSGVCVFRSTILSEIDRALKEQV